MFQKFWASKDNLTFRFMLATIIVVVFVMGIKFYWDYVNQKAKMRETMVEKAHIITEQQKALWEFMAINQSKINYDSKGHFEYKQMNCSTVAMGVGVLLSSQTEYKIKPTNLEYRNLLNKPDSFETEGIHWLKAHPEQVEYYQVQTIEEEKVFRYITPLMITEHCMECHGHPKGEMDISGYPKEGMDIGDFGGVLSLTMPTDIYYDSIKSSLWSDGFFTLVLILVCVIFIYFFVKKMLIRSLGKLEEAVSQVGQGNWDIELSDLNAKGEIKRLTTHFQNMTNQLKDLYNNLESKVEKRTNQLKETNLVLKKHQKELEEVNQRLQESNLYKSEFLAVMSHELRTPLASIMAFVEMMLEDVPPEKKEQRQNLEEVLFNSQNLLKLINNILDLAKIEANREEMVWDIVDMNDIAASVESVMMPLAKNKGLTFWTRVSSEVPLTLADMEKLRRIVENLAGNAVKFTETGGKVEINIDYREATNEILIGVTDNGIGIKEEDQKYVFEKFTQADGSASRKHGGTGLGLTLAKELIEMHGGWIRVESRPGLGSTFTAGFPVKKV